MGLKNPPDELRLELLPLVRYAVQRRMESGKPDYWDHATQLELAVLAKFEQAVVKSLTDTLAKMRESWEGETTVRNLLLIREARDIRGEAMDNALEFEQALVQ